MFDTDVPYGFLEKMFDTDETMLDVSRYNEMRTEKEPNTINDESEQTGEGLRSSEGLEGEAPATDEAKKSNHALRKLEKCKNDRTLDPHIEEQFGSGRLLACVLSPHGHYGRADRYILEKELEFYMKKIQGKKGRGAGAA